MDTILVTGTGGLVGSAAAEYLHGQGYHIVGVDNDLRGRLTHDPAASTQWNTDRLQESLRNFVNYPADIRDKQAMRAVLEEHAGNLVGMIHCAAQTAHEGAVEDGFQINTVGTLGLLDLWQRLAPKAVFIYASTIKVYGAYPNTLPYVESKTRFDLLPDHRYFKGFDETVSIDQGMSSFFGRSKTAADLYVQEFAYQYGLRAACFRPGCLTGGYHSGTEAHGMLSYLMRCAYTKTPYRIYGYEGKQVRDQLHAGDLAKAFHHVIVQPKENIVYNIGGGRENACSMLEAIEACEGITGNKMSYTFHPMRTGDHRWWITDNSRFMTDYASWNITVTLEKILEDIYRAGRCRW